MKYLVHIALLFSMQVNARDGYGGTDQEWGHVELRPGTSLFWWLFYTTANVTSPYHRPLIIWLQGGPGMSSTGFGNFEEIGPFFINGSYRTSTWVKDVNLLFVDSPVGTGFGYVTHPNNYPSTIKEVASDLVVLMKEFIRKIPDFEKVPLYIAGESFGGKVAVEFALELQKEIDFGHIQTEFKGLFLISPWIAPITSISKWSTYLQNIGIVDTRSALNIKKEVDILKELYEGNQFDQINKQSRKVNYALVDSTAVDTYNVAHRRKITELYSIPIGVLNLNYLMNNHVKEKLHLQENFKTINVQVKESLKSDFFRPVSHIVEHLLKNTNLKIYVANGQLDLVANIPGTNEWIDELNFDSNLEWDEAPRKAFIIDEFIEGYEQLLDNFGYFTILRAGHMVPVDNPAATQYILRKLTDDYQVDIN